MTGRFYDIGIIKIQEFKQNPYTCQPAPSTVFQAKVEAINHACQFTLAHLPDHNINYIKILYDSQAPINRLGAAAYQLGNTSSRTGGVGHMGGLINPSLWRGRCPSGSSSNSTCEAPFSRKRVPTKKPQFYFHSTPVYTSI